MANIVHSCVYVGQRAAVSTGKVGRGLEEEARGMLVVTDRAESVDV